MMTRVIQTRSATRDMAATRSWRGPSLITRRLSPDTPLTGNGISPPDSLKATKSFTVRLASLLPVSSPTQSFTSASRSFTNCCWGESLPLLLVINTIKPMTTRTKSAIPRPPSLASITKAMMRPIHDRFPPKAAKTLTGFGLPRTSHCPEVKVRMTKFSDDGCTGSPSLQLKERFGQGNSSPGFVEIFPKAWI